MSYCPKCKLNIGGDRKICPLCQGILDKVNDKSDEVFPNIKSTSKKKYIFVLRLLLLISAFIIIASVTINFILASTGLWALYVISGIACIWLISTAILLQRKNVLKTIFSQAIVIIALTLIWDFATGMHGWAVDFVIPITIAVATISIAILSKALKIQVEDYSIYLCNLVILNCCLIVLLLLGTVTIKIPVAISIGVNFLIITIFVIFEGKKIYADLKRRLHI